MSRKLFAVAIVGACLGLFSSAQAQAELPPPPEGMGPVFRAMGDSSPLESDERIRSRLTNLTQSMNLHPERRRFDALAAPAAPAGEGGIPPEVKAQMAAAFDEGIAQLQAELDKTSPKNAEQRQQIEESLKMLRQQRAETLGQLAPAPAEVAEVALKRPAGRDEALSFDQAIAELRKVLSDNAEPAALAAFAASEDYRSAARSAKSAAAGLMDNRPMAALAGLLRAHELQPDNPTHLANLAGLCNRLALPRHALVLLAETDKMPKPVEAGGGLDGRTVVLTNRGHALIQLGRAAEAEPVLRKAMEIDPTLAEARANLAMALWQQDDPKKKEEAVRYARLARKRATVARPEDAAAPAPPAKPKSDGEFTLAKLQQVADAGREGRPASASTLFRTAGGKEANMPTIKIPRRIADGAELHPRLEAFYKDLQAKQSGIRTKKNEVEERIRQREQSGSISPILAQRHRDLTHYIAHPEWEPSLMDAYMDQYKAGTQRNIGTYGGQMENPWADEALQKREDEIWAMPPPKDINALMHEANEPVHGKWQGPIQNYAQSIGQWLKAKHRYQTALAANIGDPLLHADVQLLIESQAIGTQMDFVGTLLFVTGHDAHFVKLFGNGPGGPGETEDPVPGAITPPDKCGPGMRGEYTASVSTGPIEIGGNCDGIYFQLSTGEYVKAFSKFTYTFNSGDVTVFVGGAGEAGLPGTTVKTAARAGAYVTINNKGELVDAGVKMTRATSVGIDLVVAGVGYEREIETPFSIVAAFGD